MQAWQIIVTSAVVASIAAAALFLPGAVRSPGGAASLFQTYWPGFIVVWLVIYSIAALALSTAEAVRELGDPASGRAGLDWPHRYLLRLGVTQYFSAVLILFAVGLLPGTIATEPVFSVPAALGSSLAPAACAMAIIVGVLGWLTATIVAAFRAPAVWTASPASPDTQLLHDTLELLRARPAEPAPLSTELAEELRQRDRATVEALRELAGAVARVRTGISEIQRGFQQLGPEQTGQSGSAALGDVAAVVGELRTATSTLTTAVTKLDDIAAALAAISPIGLSAPARGNLPPGSRSQLSTELQELLRDMTTGSTLRQDSSR